MDESSKSFSSICVSPYRNGFDVNQYVVPRVNKNTKYPVAPIKIEFIILCRDMFREFAILLSIEFLIVDM